MGYFFLLPPMEPLHEKSSSSFMTRCVVLSLLGIQTSIWILFFILYQVGVEGVICQQLPTIINNLRVNESLYIFQELERQMSYITRASNLSWRRYLIKGRILFLKYSKSCKIDFSFYKFLIVKIWKPQNRKREIATYF